MKYLLISAAALALSASGGAFAQGNGNGKGQGQGKPEQAERGAAAKPDRGNGNMRGADRGPREAARPTQRGNGNAERGNSNRPDNRGARIIRGNGNDDRGARAVRGNGNNRANYDSGLRIVRDDGRFYPTSGNRGLIDGCPPGLARKNNGCNPPGQVREQRSLFGTSYSPRLFGYGNYGDGRYFYDDGYLMRLGSNGGIAGYLPLLGGALALGNPWPSSYQSHSVPDYFVDYYDLAGPDSYRYADNVIYRVDPQTSAIQSIAALLTGDDFTVGQRVPAGYDVYNVPYAYRDRYYDTPEANYRYSDGYVYQVDPTTQLVSAVIDLLV